MSGTLAAPPLQPLSGGSRSIGPFKATAQIAAGRRSIVFLAQRDDPESLFAVHQVRAEIDAEVFEAEARGARVFEGHNSPELMRSAQGLLSFHPAVIGESLATILEHALAEKKPLDLDVALAIAMGIAAKLAKSGEKRFHGDLAPHHVLIGYDGTIHLIDAACAAYRERMKAPGRGGYRSPEHVKSEPLAPSSDIFVLGVLLFEMTTATRLFNPPQAKDTDATIIEARLPRPRDLVGDGYPIELQLVLRKLLRPAQAGRFPDGGSARDALRLVAGARAELTQAQLGNWLRTLFSDRWSTWRMMLTPKAITGIEDPHFAPRVRSPSRAPTLHIPADPTEPLVRVAMPMPLDAGRTQESPFGALLRGATIPNEATAIDTAIPPPRPTSHEPIALYRKVASSPRNEPLKITSSPRNEPLKPFEPRPFSEPLPADEEAAVYATKLALENIESLDDLPPRPKRDSSTRRDLRAIQVDAHAATPPPDLSRSMEPTPLPEPFSDPFHVARDTDALRAPRDVARLSSSTGGTPTPLMEMELVNGQLVGPSGQRVPIDVVQPVARMVTSPRGSTPTPLLEMDLINVAKEMRLDDTDGGRDATPPIEVGSYDGPIEHDPFEDFALTDSSDPKQELARDDAPEWAGDGEVEFLSDSLPPEVERRPPSNVADDLLLPEPTPAPRLNMQLDALTRDLLGERDEFDDAPATSRGPVPFIAADDDVNDTIDEGSAREELPSALVAQVLAEAEVLPELADENTHDDRIEPVRPERRRTFEDLNEAPTIDEHTASRDLPALSARRDTPPMHTPPMHTPPMYAPPMHAAPPRSDTEPMGEAARARMQALASRSQPVAGPAQRGRLNIPGSATAPSAAKPNLVISRSAAQEQASPLWGQARELEGSGQRHIGTDVVRDRIERQHERTPQARVPTLVVRERIVPNTDPSEPPERRDRDRDREHPRERDQPSGRPPRAEGVRVREQMVPTDDTSSSLVIPIPDDELDRAARKKKLAVVFAIAGMAMAVLAVIAVVIILLLRDDAIPLALNAPPEIPRNIVHPQPAPDPEPAVVERPGIEPVTQPTHTATHTATLATKHAPKTEVKNEPVEALPEGDADAKPARTKVHVLARPKGVKIVDADGNEVKNGGYVEVGEDTVELSFSMPGYDNEHVSIQPGDTKDEISVLLKKRR